MRIYRLLLHSSTVHTSSRDSSIQENHAFGLSYGAPWPVEGLDFGESWKVLEIYAVRAVNEGQTSLRMFCMHGQVLFGRIFLEVDNHYTLKTTLTVSTWIMKMHPEVKVLAIGFKSGFFCQMSTRLCLAGF